MNWPCPINEEGGLNLYGFVKNCPISKFDLRGLSCCDVCPKGAIRKLVAEYKMLARPHTPTSKDAIDAQADAIDNASTGSDIIGYVTDPIGTLLENVTFNFGGVGNVVDTAMDAQATWNGVWLFIRFKYQECEYVRCFPQIWKKHTDWVDHGPTSWQRGTKGQDSGLDAFINAEDVKNNLHANTDDALKGVFGD